MLHFFYILDDQDSNPTDICPVEVNLQDMSDWTIEIPHNIPLNLRELLEHDLTNRDVIYTDREICIPLNLTTTITYKLRKTDTTRCRVYDINVIHIDDNIKAAILNHTYNHIRQRTSELYFDDEVPEILRHIIKKQYQARIRKNLPIEDVSHIQIRDDLYIRYRLTPSTNPNYSYMVTDVSILSLKEDVVSAIEEKLLEWS